MLIVADDGTPAVLFAFTGGGIIGSVANALFARIYRGGGQRKTARPTENEPLSP